MLHHERRPGDGWFVTIEGPEGAGKTSQARRLAAAARAAGIAVTTSREPGGTPAGERIRTWLLERRAPSHGRSPVASDAPGLDPRTDALLFNAARAQLVRDVVRPALARGELVLVSRFGDSTLAYQGHGASLPVADLRALEHFATTGLRPDLTVLLDLPPEVGLARKSGAEVTRFEADFDLAFHRRVRDGFLALAAAEPDRFAIVDAVRPPDEVFAAIVAAVTALPGLANLAEAARDGASGTVAASPVRPGTPPEPDRAEPGEPNPGGERITG